jgi:imidazolonepropionase-like amidohydrolase
MEPGHTDGIDRWLLIKAGILFDGSGALLRDAEVLVHDDRIVEVGPAGSLDLPQTPLAEVNASEGSVIPGLIDCHLHVTYSGHMGMHQLEWPNSLEFAAVAAGANATRALMCGYTSGLDVGCRGTIGTAVKDAIAKGVVRGPDLRVSGQIISSVGGPVDLWPSNVHVDQPTRLFKLVSGAEEMRRTIREQAKHRVDNVKLQMSGSAVQQKSRGRATVFSEDELRSATETAQDLGLSAAAHAEGPGAISDAIRAGFDTIQHASFIDDPTIGLLEAHPSSRLVFTLGVYDDILQHGASLGYPSESIERIRASWEAMVSAVRLAYDRGVPFAVGSDAGGAVHPHGRYARDIVLLVQSVGISPEHAIRAATENAARAAWFEGVGTLARGMSADLVVISGDISRRIQLVEDEASISVVIQKGRVVKGSVATAGAALRVA